jgi:hypothetical protein
LDNLKIYFRLPRGLRSASAAIPLLGLRVRITTGVWTSVSFECCVLSGGVDHLSRGVLTSVVCLRVVGCKDNTAHLLSLGRRVQTKIERTFS